MSDSAEIVLCYTCLADQFMSDSAEILIFTQRNALQRIDQLPDAFRQVCSAEQRQIFSLGMSDTFTYLINVSYLIFFKFGNI
jgi:hypothetical protein